jgi:hypothetical protein
MSAEPSLNEESSRWLAAPALNVDLMFADMAKQSL